MKFSPTIRAAWLLCLAAFLCVGSTGLRAQPKPGIIQITCEPGVLVFLDGELKGETAAELGGMILRAVTPGTRALKFVKDGFDPAEGRVVVEPGGVAAFKVQPFAREMKVKQSGKAGDSQITQKTGRLVIQSVPIQCGISIPGLALQRSQKTNDLWELEEVKIGEFEATFEGAGQRIAHRIVIREKALTHLFVDFLEGKIEDRSPPAAPTAEEKAAKLAAAPTQEAPLVKQRAAPAVQVAPPRSAEEVIDEFKKNATAHEATVAALDGALGRGGMTLDEVSAASVAREWHIAGAKAAHAGIAQQEAKIVAARRDLFTADFARLRQVMENEALPAAAKAAAWLDVVKKWQVRGAPDSPEQGRFDWTENGPEFTALGGIAIVTMPTGARLEIRPQSGAGFGGRAPWSRMDVPEGRYVVTAELERHTKVTRIVTVKRGETVRVELALESVGPKRGAAIILTNPQIELAWITSGTFRMGDSGNYTVSHTRGFWLGKTEVTQAQWQAVMGNNPSNFKGSDRPVESVSWEDAMAFCKKLTERERAAGRLGDDLEYTLPTEAQWEYACRAGTTGDYAGDLDAMAWYGKNSGSQTHAVGTKAANAWGLHDMHGNVWEWCRDWYGEYSGGSVRDPVGAASGSNRVYRGGGWWNAAGHCRSAYRYGNSPDYRFHYLGFRFALSSVP